LPTRAREELQAALHALEAEVESSIKDVSLKASFSIAALEKEIKQKLAESGTFAETAQTRSRRLSQNSKDAWIDDCRRDDGRRIPTRCVQQDIDYRLVQFDKVYRRYRTPGQSASYFDAGNGKRVTGEFELYAQDQQSRLDTFSKKLLGEAEGLSVRMQTLESGLNELKAALTRTYPKGLNIRG